MMIFMEHLNLGRRNPRERPPLATYEPIQTSARPNSEVDNEEVRARLPVIIVLLVAVMAFVFVSGRAGVIAIVLGIAVLALRHLFAFRR